MRVALALFVTGCAMGAPPAFSPGESWTVPLVDPLSDGRLLVPVKIHGHGPYLFVLDRDSRAYSTEKGDQGPFTVVDPQVASDVGLISRGGVRLDDYNDTTHQAFYSEMTDVQVGTLSMSLVRVAILHKPNMLDEDGRRIYGVLGRDFVADSLVFGFDRDRGYAWVQTQEAFKPPQGANVLELSKYANDGRGVLYQPVVADVKIGGATVDVHPDFGMASSQLVESKWQSTQLSPLGWDLPVVDSTGTSHHVDRLGVGAVSARGVARDRVAFAPYEDRRYRLYHLDGTLGLDFFRPFGVAADWHHQKIYLHQRQDAIATRAVRLERWGDAIPRCPDLACMHVELLDDTGEVPAVRVHPDPVPAHDLEVIVAATGKSGAALPNIILNLPAGTEGFDAKLPTRYVGAQLAIVDASPFPRMCPTTQGCLMIASPLPP
jgi:hypothetical protein